MKIPRIPEPRTEWTELNFGKHKGKTLPQVMFSDPGWFFWAFEKDLFRERTDIRNQAAAIHAKVTSIYVPTIQVGDDECTPHQVEYLFGLDGKFHSFRIVESDQPAHQGGSISERADHIDMSILYRRKNYDKAGYILFLDCLKAWLLNSSSLRMTEARCAEFFNDRTRFRHNK